METLRWQESFALASDAAERAALVAQLVPGSEPQLFYSLLLAQAESPSAVTKDEVAAVAAVNKSRKDRSVSSRIEELLVRHQLRLHDEAPPGPVGDAERRATWVELARKLRVQFADSRVVPPHEVAARQHPSVLDASECTELSGLLKRLKGRSDLAGFASTPAATAFLCRAAVADPKLLSPTQLDQLLQQVTDPAVAGPDGRNLVKLLQRNFEDEKLRRSFGQLGVHGALTLQQLDQLGQAVPSLLTQQAFVEARLLRMRPAADPDKLPTEERVAYLAAMGAYVASLKAPFDALRTALLYRQLRIGSAAGIYDFRSFQEYIRTPRNSRLLEGRFREKNQQKLVSLSSSFAAVDAVGNDSQLLEDFVTRFFEDDSVVSISEFEKYLDNDWLRRLLALVKTRRAAAGGRAVPARHELLVVVQPQPQPEHQQHPPANVQVAAASGAAGDASVQVHVPAPDQAELVRWLGQMEDREKQRERDTVSLAFDPSNPPQVSTEDELSLLLMVQNPGRLTVRVFEINARAYYRTHLAPIESSLSLEGLTPHQSAAVDLTAASPYARMLVRVRVPSLRGRRGVFVVDVLGNGKNCRALVQKGRVLFVERQTVAGHVFRLFDENNNLIRGGSVWLDGRAYQASADRDEVIVPYTREPRRKTVVLESADGDAGLGTFDHSGEEFVFTARMLVDRESLLERQESEVLVRPALLLNGQTAPLKMVRRAAVQVQSTDSRGIVSTASGPLDLAAAGDCVFRFPVVANVRSVQATVTAEVVRASDGETERFSSSTDVEVGAAADAGVLEDVHLRRSAGTGYWLLVLGAGGEPRPLQTVTVVLRTALLNEEQHFQLQADQVGRIALGHLRGVVSVQATAAGGSSRLFTIQPSEPGARAGWPGRLVLRQGDSAVLPPPPPPFVPDADAHREVGDLATSCSLLRYVPGFCSGGGGRNVFVEDHTARGLQCTADGSLVLSANLPAGQYLLRLRDAGVDVAVEVVAGQLLLRRYVLSSTALEELSQPPAAEDGPPTGMAPFATRGDSAKRKRKASENDDPATIRLVVHHATSSTRVHVIASHFVPDARAPDAFASVEVPQPNLVSARVPPVPPCVYLAQRDISDELRYVMDRRDLPKRLGNMLDRPSMLLAPKMTRVTTEADAPTLRQQGQFQPAAPLAEAKMQMSRSMAAPYQQRSQGFGGGGGGGGGGFGGFRNGRGAQAPNALAPAFPFLGQPSTRLLNLRPGPGGVVELDRAALGPTQTHVRAVVVDRHHTTSLEFALGDPELESRAPAEPPVGLADPRSYVDTRLMPALPAGRHWTEQHLVTCVQPGGVFEMDDPRTATVVVYDRLEDAYALLFNLLASGSEQTAALKKFDFLPRWTELTEAEKESHFSELVCHELNFFIARRDPAFFQRVVRPYLANRMPQVRTFMDDYLLGLPLDRYSEPAHFASLNALEKILFAEARAGGPAADREEVATLFRDLQARLTPDQQAFVRRFETALKVKASVPVPEAPDETPEAEMASGNGMPGGPPPPPPAAAPAPAPAVAQMASAMGFGAAMRSASGARGRGPVPMSRGMFAMKEGCADEDAPRREKKMKRSSKMRSVDIDDGEGAASSDDEDDNADEQAGMSEQVASEELALQQDIDQDAYLAARSSLKQLYRPPGPTKEYEDTAYLLNELRSDTRWLVPFSQFWADYAEHVLRGAGGTGAPFLTAALPEACSSFTEVVAALAVLSLPLGTPASLPRVESSGARPGERFRLRASAEHPCLVFHKEVRDTPLAAPPSVSVSHVYFDPQDRYRNDPAEGRVDKFVEGSELLINKEYVCRVVLTNVSSTTQRVSVLLQVPEGSLPVMRGPSFFTETRFLTLSAYTTECVEYGFYFPFPGTFRHYPVQVAKRSLVVGHGAEQALRAVFPSAAAKPVDHDSWIHVAQQGTDADLVAFLRSRNVQGEDLSLMLWRFAGQPSQSPPDAQRALFAAVLAALRARRVFDVNVWRYSLRLGPSDAVAEYLATSSDLAAMAGPFLQTSLLRTDQLGGGGRSVGSGPLLTLLEYTPLLNARAHRLRARGAAGGSDAADELVILNRQLREQYQGVLRYLAFRAAGRSAVRAEHDLAVVYYLLVQDRVEEADRLFRSLDLRNLPPLVVDYVAAYLAMFVPGGPARALELASKYAGYPVARKRRLFEEVRRHVEQAGLAVAADGGGKRARVVDDEGDVEMGGGEPAKSEQKPKPEPTAAEAAEAFRRQQDVNPDEEPFLEFSVEGCRLTVRYRSVDRCRLNLYFLDVETAFSARPFDAAGGNRSLVVSPNVTREVALDRSASEFSIDLPDRANMYVEVQGLGAASHISITKPHFSNSLTVQVIERAAQLRVTDRDTGAPLPLCYVKVYASKPGGGNKFWKDGYTDLRGRFDYASVSGADSGSSLSGVQGFSVLVLDDNHGALVREVPKPAC